MASSSSLLSTSDAAGGGNGCVSNSSFSFSKPPIFLLKTKSTPTDGYDEYFRNNTSIPNTISNNGSSSSSGGSGFTGGDGYEPIFVPVLEHRFNETNLRVLKEYFLPTDSEGGRTFLNDGGRNGQRRKYGGIIFTSQRAVEGFAKLLVDEVGGMYCNIQTRTYCYCYAMLCSGSAACSSVGIR
jgi:uroporphyrinogen-III synthase